MAVENTSEQSERTTDALTAFRVLLPGTQQAGGSGAMGRRWVRLLIVVAVAVGYAFLWLLLGASLGSRAGVLAIVPVTIGGLLFGVRGGTLTGLAALPANTLLLNLADSASDGVLFAVRDLPPAAILVLAGGLIGKLRDLAAQVADQLKDRAAAHDEVRRLSHQNHLLLNAVGEGVCGVDLDGNTTFSNLAAARMLGRSPTLWSAAPSARYSPMRACRRRPAEAPTSSCSPR